VDEHDRAYENADRRLREARLVACLKAEWLADATARFLAPRSGSAEDAAIEDRVDRQIMARELAALQAAIAKAKAADAEVSAVMAREVRA
jgi:hypothetical protein